MGSGGNRQCPQHLLLEAPHLVLRLENSARPSKNGLSPNRIKEKGLYGRHTAAVLVD